MGMDICIKNPTLAAPLNPKPSYRALPAILSATVTLAASIARTAQATEPVDYIDPFIGTGRQGKTFPGASTPGGMIQA